MDDNMKAKFILGMFSLVSSFTVMADQSFFCPAHSRYINLGMTPDEVIAACGQPLSQQDSKDPVFQKVPVQQLFFNNQGTGSSFYGVWNVSTGNTGAQLQVDVLDNKVKAIKINGSSSNAFSICRGANIQIGDPVGKVYSSCGNPSITNNTFTNIPIQSAQKPVIWVYQIGQYQAPMTLTFVNGKLQSINN